MKKMLFVFAMLFCVTIAQAEDVDVAEPGKWGKAGAEIKEAAHSVGDATVDSSQKAWEATKEGTTKVLDATKEGSVGAWDKTKENSKKVWEKGKEKIHDVTAPKSVVPKTD